MAPLNIATGNDNVSPLPRIERQQRSKPNLLLDTDILPQETNMNDISDITSDPLVSEGQALVSMQLACQLVNKLLDQVAWNDAPPSNEAVSENETPNLQSNSPRLTSRQCHVSPLSPSNNNAILETTTESNDPSDLWNVHYQVRCNQRERKLGNAALAALCSRTLETVGKPTLSPEEAFANRMEDQLKLSPSHSPDIPSRQGYSPKKSWLRLRSKKHVRLEDRNDCGSERNSETQQNRTASLTVTQSNEDSVKNISCMRNNGYEPRLQMFGSEYARYLSTTVFKPKDASASQPSLGNFSRKRQEARKIQNIEDTDDAILTGAVTDVIITHGDDLPPKGYYRISQSGSGQEFSLRNRKTVVNLFVKKEPNWDRAAQRPCVTALVVIFPERKEFVPPGFSVVRRFRVGSSSGTDATASNLNFGGEPVYLCFRRSREGNPITGIVPLQPSYKESVPEGYTVLERSPRNFVANLRAGAGPPAFLAYRQRLANLEPLRPIPFVISVQRSLSSARRLHAYYCTGGTVVESKVGRFHIMDRSTHSLLSPSSVSNRLSLIEISRRKMFRPISELTRDATKKYLSSGTVIKAPPSPGNFLTSSILLAHGLERPSTKSVASHLERLSTLGDFDSVSSSDMSARPRVIISTDHEFRRNARRSYSSVASEEESASSPLALTSPIQVDSIFSEDASELRRCLETLSFIPVVSTSVNENNPKEIFLFQARVALLTPVLTACYTRHGGSSLVAVEGLTSLLRNDFFASDVGPERKAQSSRLTLLDTTIQVVCDVATTGVQEAQLQACVEFVETAIRYGCRHLNNRTIGFVLRFYLFVFYFGVSIPSRGGYCSWTDKLNDEPLLNDPRSSKSNYLPGGAPQLAALALKELVSFSVARLNAIAVMDCRKQRRAYCSTDESKQSLQIINLFLGEILSDVVDESVNRVDVANYTQLAMHQIHRSGGSELFWHDMLTCCGKGLFGSDSKISDEGRNMYTVCFALLANLVKVASTKLKRGKSADVLPRDLSSKLLSLEILHHFLTMWAEGQETSTETCSRSIATFAFCVRRLLTHCLMINTKEGLNDPRIYGRMIRILGVLWRSPIYRKNMKLELGILFEHFVLRLLQLGPQLPSNAESSTELTPCLLEQQVILITEIATWFSSDSKDLLELFINFDTKSRSYTSPIEPISGLQWKIFQRLIGSLCSIAEQCSEFLGDQIRQSEFIHSHKGAADSSNRMLGEKEKALDREAAKRLRKIAIQAVSQILKSLAQVSATAVGERFKAVSVGKSGYSRFQEKKCEGSTPHTTITSPTSSTSSASNDETGDEGDSKGSSPSLLSPKIRPEGNVSIVGYWQQAIVRDRRTPSGQASPWRHDAYDQSGPVYSGISRPKEEDSANGKVDHLGIAFDIAGKKSLEKAIDYLVACNILTSSPRDIASFLRIHKSDLNPTDLGKYLGEGGNDASEIEHWNLIRFNFIRANSFVGLTVEEGLRHLLTNCGFRLPGEAQQIDRLMTTFSQCYWEDNAGDRIRCPFLDVDTVFVLSFAIIMLNTDLHKSSLDHSSTGRKLRKKMTKTEFLNNLRGVGRSDELPHDYLFDIYDSIEKNPIQLQGKGPFEGSNGSRQHLRANLGAMIDNVKAVDALLRGLSIHEHRFYTLEDHIDTTAEPLEVATGILARNCFVNVWHHLHGFVNAAIDIAHLDSQEIESCVGILRYALCLTISLDMPIERAAFLGQMGRIKSFVAWKSGEAKGGSVDHDSYKNEHWYLTMEEAFAKSSSERGKICAIEKVIDLVSGLQSIISTDSESQRKAMIGAVKSLQDGDFLLNDPCRFFVKKGDILKRSNLSGRCTEYRFFLFSDMLVYAKRTGGLHSDLFKIHEEIPLILMKVVDWFPREMKKESKRAFQIYHPKKKFIVYCTSREERQSWVSAIRKGIRDELDRKVSMEAARKAASKSH